MKSESSLLFSYENIITKAANMRTVKACAPRWRLSFVSSNW